MKVIVLMGGASAEREVSLTTGSGIAAALRRLGHEVVTLDGPPAELVAAPALAGADVVFIALHGGAGEDGTLQAVLDLSGRPYTGSGLLASALAMDKAMSKRLVEHAGIPTPRWLLLPADGPPPMAEDLEPLGGLPVVVKPNDQGSTVGLSLVREPGDLARAFTEAARFSRGVLVETYVPGRELTVGVLGGEALPVVEIFPEGGLYDYRRKYTAGQSRYECPAQLESGLAARICELGRRAFQVLGCRGVARVDFRLDPEGRPYCLEVNTVPGMTPTSLVPMAAAARGLSYDELVARMLELAQEPAAAPGGGIAAR